MAGSKSRGLYEAEWRTEPDGADKWNVYIGERLIGRVWLGGKGKFSASLNARNPHEFWGFPDLYAAGWFLVRKFDR